MIDCWLFQISHHFVSHECSFHQNRNPKKNHHHYDRMNAKTHTPGTPNTQQSNKILSLLLCYDRLSNIFNLVATNVHRNTILISTLPLFPIKPLVWRIAVVHQQLHLYRLNNFPSHLLSLMFGKVTFNNFPHTCHHSCSGSYCTLNPYLSGEKYL